MSLVNCDECGKEISDRASACPACGCPTHPTAGSDSAHAKAQAMLAKGTPAPTVAKATGLSLAEVVQMRAGKKARVEVVEQESTRVRDGIIGLVIGAACILDGMFGTRSWISTVIGIGCVITGAAKLSGGKP